MKKGLLLASCFLLLASSTTYAQSVDLLWQGETYASPFYKGRTLWSSQSRITLVAIPHGLGNPSNLNYKWTKTGTILGNRNGVGKNNISFTDSVLSRPQTIKVEILPLEQGDILSSDRAVLASASVNIAPIRPALIIYENNPLYGFMFHREVGNTYKLETKEITFTAFPFFFIALDRMDTSLSYEWSTNAGGAGTRSSVTYRTPDDATGSSAIQVRAVNKDKITQSANKNFLIQYGNE